MSDSTMKLFENQELGQLHAMTDENGEPWFVARDVARALGLRDADRITRRLDPCDFRTLSKGTSGLSRDMQVINESGLYCAVLASKKPEAKAFKRWVTSEVLPSIRRTGGYIAAKADETPEQIMARALVVANETLERMRNQAAALEAEAEAMRPKAVFADAVAASDTTILVGELAKILAQNGVKDMGQNRLFAWMRENGYLVARKGTDYNMPTQRSVEMGLFRIKETAITHADGHTSISKTVKITGKGQSYFIAKFLGRDAA